MVQRGVSVPPSRQLAAILRDRIESGEIPPGGALPSIVSLASEYHVATNTVQKALKILRDDGLVESVPGYGTFAVKK
jgi:GntR family transcriptional regulator